MSYFQDQKENLWKPIWNFKYRVLLFIFLWVVTYNGFYEILFFIPKSWGNYGDGEVRSLRGYVSFLLGLTVVGFAFYRYYTLREDNYYLKMIVHLFYALNPKSKTEIMNYYVDTDPYPAIADVIERDFSRHTRADRFIEDKDAAMFIITDKQLSSLEYNNLLPVLRRVTRLVDDDPNLRELKTIERIISFNVNGIIDEQCKEVVYNLKSNIMALFLENDFTESKIREELRRRAAKEDRVVMKFVEGVVRCYFNKSEKIDDAPKLHDYLIQRQKEIHK